MDFRSIYPWLFCCPLCQDSQSQTFGTNPAYKDVFLICQKKTCRAAFSFSTIMAYLRGIIVNLHPDHCFGVNPKRHVREDSPTPDIDYRLSRGKTGEGEFAPKQTACLTRPNSPSSVSLSSGPLSVISDSIDSDSVSSSVQEGTSSGTDLDMQGRLLALQRENVAMKNLNFDLTETLKSRDAKLALLEAKDAERQKSLDTLERCLAFLECKVDN